MGKRSTIDFSNVIAQLRKVPGALEAGIKPAVHRLSRSFVKQIVEITPPGSGKTAGMKAKKQGEAAVARDIYRVYATPGQAYRAINEVDEAAAETFWALYAEGNYADAGEILRTLGGRAFGVARSFGSFDGGAMHKRFRGSGGRVHRNRVYLVVTDPKVLSAYVRKMQGRVGLLASGWNTAAAKLGVKLPAWVTRHGNANGAITVETGDNKLVIVMSNHVKYGAAHDLQRRADSVVFYLHRSLKRQMPHILRAALKKAGMPTSGRQAA